MSSNLPKSIVPFVSSLGSRLAGDRLAFSDIDDVGVKSAIILFWQRIDDVFPSFCKYNGVIRLSVSGKKILTEIVASLQKTKGWHRLSALERLQLLLNADVSFFIESEIVRQKAINGYLG